jgi:hypothetical protein
MESASIIVAISNTYSFESIGHESQGCRLLWQIARIAVKYKGEITMALVGITLGGEARVAMLQMGKYCSVTLNRRAAQTAITKSWRATLQGNGTSEWVQHPKGGHRTERPCLSASLALPRLGLGGLGPAACDIVGCTDSQCSTTLFCGGAASAPPFYPRPTWISAAFS